MGRKSFVYGFLTIILYNAVPSRNWRFKCFFIDFSCIFTIFGIVKETSKPLKTKCLLAYLQLGTGKYRENLL